ncbi:right-handed parallel beta-helix repeat-containing protein [Natrinema saccharevitans]|uniref:right-handed parallel beta-helix repeat-containing protein n=1 Tax=Natrinema saccharevitans TaxID=301967 RepID=UPI00096EFD17|nr:right-handed parallel beta-helix repeat-containing protein [Natrinema saccharevitans]
MARDNSVLDDVESTDTESLTAGSGSNSGLLHRRRYLKFLGTAATAAAAMTGVTSAADDYDVIEVGAGESRTVRLDDGETFENKLIDITANNARFHIRAIADDWEIRNIGFRGNWDSTEKADAIICQVNSPDATGLIENVYFMGSQNDDTYPGITGINVANGHYGRVEIRNVNIQNCPDNSVYASNPGDPADHTIGAGGGGEVIIRDSYARNSRAGGFRVGTDGSLVDNCVVVGCDKGVWGYYEHIEVRDSDISDCKHADIRCGAQNWDKSQQAEITVTNTRYETTDNRGAAIHGSSAGTAQRTEPEDVAGVPLSPEAAASGSSGSSDDSTGGSDDATDEPESEGSLLAFITEPDASYASYEFTADGPVEFADAPYESPSGGRIEGGTYTSEDFVESDDGTWRAGGVTGGGHGDAYRVDGSLTSINVDNPDVMWVELDGEEIDPDSVGDSDLENTLLVDGVGTAGGTRYEFTVSGAVEKSTAGSASINADDRIESGTVTGSVGGWRDAFSFSGDLEELTVDGTARVYVNGDQVDPADYGDERPHVLTLVGNGSAANYEISVDGTIDAAVGDDAAASATISENTVDGSIDRGVQRFRFSGTVSDITFTNGSANVYVDDEEVEPDEVGESELLPHAITIDGRDADGDSSYVFETDGDVVASSYRDATVDDGDVIDGTTVSGSVADSLDAYWFDGDIVDFRLTGDASVDVEYDVRD